MAISNVLASINKVKEGFDMGFLSSDIVELDDNDENETEHQNELQNEVNDVMSSNPLKNTIIPPDVKTEDDTSKTLVRFTQKEDEYLMLGIKNMVHVIGRIFCLIKTIPFILIVQGML